MKDIFSYISNGDVIGLETISQLPLEEQKRILYSSNDIGYTPLCYSIVENKKECFDTLTEVFNVNPDSPREWFNVSTPLIESIYGYYENIEEDKINYMHYFQTLLQRGADPNLPDNYGNTPLHYSMKLGLDIMTRILIESGGDPYIQNHIEKSALDVAYRDMKSFIEEIAYMNQPKEPNID